MRLWRKKKAATYTRRAKLLRREQGRANNANRRSPQWRPGSVVSGNAPAMFWNPRIRDSVFADLQGSLRGTPLFLLIVEILPPPCFAGAEIYGTRQVPNPFTTLYAFAHTAHRRITFKLRNILGRFLYKKQACIVRKCAKCDITISHPVRNLPDSLFPLSRLLFFLYYRVSCEKREFANH